MSVISKNQLLEFHANSLLSYLFYPETAGRSLEELDVLFAVAYLEGKSYVQVGNEMPKLSDAQVESENHRLADVWAGRKEMVN